MQTFLPDPDFEASATMLDNKRLGKQRVEVLQMLKALNGESKGRVNHPATRMWRGYEKALIEYGTAICFEWVCRGYRDTCADKIKAYYYEFPDSDEGNPPWLGDPTFHASHRSNLKRKDPVEYPFKEPDDMEYIWPVS